MIATIEISGDLPHFSTRADLDGTTFTLRFRWSDRNARWTVDLLDDAESVCFVAGWPLEPIRTPVQALLAGVRSDSVWQSFVFGRAFAPGALIATSTAPLTTQAGLAEIDLSFYDAAEMLAAAADLRAA